MGGLFFHLANGGYFLFCAAVDICGLGRLAQTFSTGFFGFELGGRGRWECGSLFGGERNQGRHGSGQGRRSR